MAEPCAFADCTNDARHAVTIGPTPADLVCPTHLPEMEALVADEAAAGRRWTLIVHAIDPDQETRT
jgi:hypothetical protein